MNWTRQQSEESMISKDVCWNFVEEKVDRYSKYQQKYVM